MKYADIKLGYTCNNNCLHCVIAEQRKRAIRLRGNQDRSTEEYMQELIGSRNDGCTSVTFTGGEPTIRRDLLDLVRYAKSIGFSISMQTNGRMFSYIDFAKKFSGFGIRYVIALHGADQETHEMITCSKESFNQTVNGIKNIISLGGNVFGKVVISKLNYAQLDRICKFLFELGVKSINLAFPHAQGNAWYNFDSVVPRYTDIMPYVKKTIELSKIYGDGHSITFEAIPLCFLGDDFRLSSDLKVNGLACDLKQLDNTTLNWASVRKKIKSKFKACNGCKFCSICEGPWKEYAEKYGESEFIPIVD